MVLKGKMPPHVTIYNFQEYLRTLKNRPECMLFSLAVKKKEKQKQTPIAILWVVNE